MSYYFKEKRAESSASQRIVNFTLTSSKNADDIIPFALHNHDIFELSAVTMGRLDVSIDEAVYELSEGDIIIANPYELHEGKRHGESEYEYITMTCPINTLLFSSLGGMKTEIGDLLSSRSGFKTKIGKDEPNAKRIAELMKRGYEATKKDGAVGKCSALSQAFEIFSLLFELYYGELEKTGNRKNNKDFFKAVTAYLDEHYRDRISTSNISAALYMSESQFCHSFRKYYNESFSRFLCKYRVTKAAQNISGEKSKSLAEIARGVGFSSYQYFAHAFMRQFGCSPSAYFKAKKESSR